MQMINFSQHRCNGHEFTFTELSWSWGGLSLDGRRNSYIHKAELQQTLSETSGVAKGAWGVRTAPGGNLLGAANGQF